MAYATNLPAEHGLPDPDLDRQFYVGVPARRLAAWFIDLVVTLVITVVAGLAIAVLTLGIGFLLLPPIAATVAFLYRTLTIGNRSATWGMRMMGIEFRNRSGDRFDMTTAAIHTGIYMLCVFTVVGWLVHCIAIVGSRFGQGIPDLLLGTTAINRPVN